MKVAMCVCLSVLSASALAGASKKQCERLDPTHAVSKPLTIAVIEREQMSMLEDILKIRPDYPKVPFGFINAEWVAFKSAFRPGDKIVRYSTKRHSWQHLGGEAGYALIQSGCVIKMFTTMLN